MGPAWFLDKVTVTEAATGKSWFFPCGKWFATDFEDKLIERVLTGTPTDPKVVAPIARYKIEFHTGNVRGAGTDANVYVHLCGIRNIWTDKFWLPAKRTSFEVGSKDTFRYECPDLGTLTRLRVGHDNRGFASGWFLDKVIVTKEGTTDAWTFVCNRWLDVAEDDHKIERELVATAAAGTAMAGLVPYSVMVVTGDKMGMGTDANVFVNLMSKAMSSGELKLDAKNGFAAGSKNEFKFMLPELGELSQLRVWHDNKGFSAGWFLISITVTSGGKTYFFPCNRWLDTGEDDHKIDRTLSVAPTKK
eukprot:TRINITY_DN203_c0_g1_i6.p2 TRINITY_DN203_c0_g1~~TRINITY_DN203_c0_g1_i6.p2  ORF type:complete len:304 (-),score=123.76 TRINITY_DN203_c0_g1_i6:224-1135(-)